LAKVKIPIENCDVALEGQQELMTCQPERGTVKSLIFLSNEYLMGNEVSG
jgi:hypothetical protein